MEIERKWRLESVPPEVLERAGEPIVQGYLALGEGGREVRLRRRGERCFLTVKAGEGLVREEREVELTARQFEELWPATEGRRVEKVRRVLEHGPGVAVEVDVFGGALSGLAVAEVEFADAESAARFAAPEWFGAEVTDDPAYRNQRLALAGLPSVTDAR